LLHVSEEELKPNPKPEGPKTCKKKIENYWYHYKWHTISAVVVIGIAAYMIGEMLLQVKPDYSIVLATDTAVLTETDEAMEAVMQTYANDVNGDGTVYVEIEVLNFGDESSLGTAYQYKLMAHLAAGDVLLYILDQTTYENEIRPMESDGDSFFAKLDFQANGIEGDGRYWNWKDDAMRSDEVFSALPENLYFGIREATGSSNNSSTEDYNQCMELLKAFIMKTPLQTE
jgi:hypothetical protein